MVTLPGLERLREVGLETWSERQLEPSSHQPPPGPQLTRDRRQARAKVMELAAGRIRAIHGDRQRVMTMSEFGRAAAENGNSGTDHRNGNAMFVLGGRVKGGRVYGRWPGLDQQDRFGGRDLAVTTDFRDAFGEVVSGHLGASREALPRVFPGTLRRR